MGIRYGLLSSLAMIISTLPSAHAQSPQSQNLQPESQQEFRRVYGTSGGTNTSAQRPPSQLQSGPAISGLKPESFREFQRVFGQNVLSGTVDLQKMATPSTINSTILSTLTSSADNRKYFILWHLISVDLTAVDHRAIFSASPSTYHEQFGPARTARALALIHQAMFETANMFERKYLSTLDGMSAPSIVGASQDAALVEAAYQIITWLYPGLKEQQIATADPNNVCESSQFSITAYYTCSLNSIANASERDAGIAVGRAVAGKIIAERSGDGAERVEPIFIRDLPPRQALSGNDFAFTQWQQDPVSQLATALGGYWGNVKPFALTSGFQFRPAETESPALRIPKDGAGKLLYRDLPSYNVIAQLGRETRLDPSGQAIQPPISGDGFFVAQLWAYDGTANVCAPARLYNQIAAAVLDHIEKNPGDGYANAINVKSITDVARFYALVNLAMADAAVAAWDAKYHFQFPRPITYIRAVDEKEMAAQNKPVNSKWFPVGAQNTNSDQPFNITPPFPSYPSGHAVFGGALFGILRQFIKPDSQFSFLSDEFNGRNKDVFNYVRCSDQDMFTPKTSKFCTERKFTLDCAERENADSRLFMGVHWVFDADDGVVIGNKVARQAYKYLMKPVDAQGQPFDAPAKTFSVAGSPMKTRADLVCPGVTYPTGWDDPDAKKGFGPLNVVVID